MAEGDPRSASGPVEPLRDRDGGHGPLRSLRASTSKRGRRVRALPPDRAAGMLRGKPPRLLLACARRRPVDRKLFFRAGGRTAV